MNTERLVNQFIEMVNIDSESKNEKNFADYLSDQLSVLGFEVKRDNSGELSGSNTDNVYGFFKGTKPCAPLLFSAHMDTVVPGKGINPIVKDGVIYSDGTTVLGSDDKAGVVSMLSAIRHIVENNIPHGDIEVLFTICEEVGLLGARYCDYSMIKSNIAFVLDSGGDVGNVVIGAPSQAHLKVAFIGKTAHAGSAPELGISAIQMAARAIHRMELLRIDNETTANVGIIHGGMATNIVCDRCDIVIESRSHNREKLDRQNEHMTACITESADFYGGKAEIDLSIAYNAFRLTEKDQVVKIAKKAAEKINVPFHTSIGGGGSDGNIYMEHGIESLVIGVGMSKVHTKDEFIEIKNLEKAVEYIVAIIETI